MSITVADALSRAEQQLVNAQCPNPRGDALTIVADVADMPIGALTQRPDAMLTDDAEIAISAYVERRATREPLGYVLGWSRFRGLTLHVNSDVLVPVPASALLVQFALKLPSGARVHEVGTGAGAVAIAIQLERPDLVVSASDISPDAVAVARRNVERHNVNVDVQTAPFLPDGEYDLVVAHLPFVDDAQEAMPLPPEDAHQPHVAVSAGVDGMSVIDEFIKRADTDAEIALQHAPSQADAVGKLLADSRRYDDPGGTFAFTTGRLKQPGPDAA